MASPPRLSNGHERDGSHWEYITTRSPLKRRTVGMGSAYRNARDASIVSLVACAISTTVLLMPARADDAPALTGARRLGARGRQHRDGDHAGRSLFRALRVRRRAHDRRQRRQGGRPLGAEGRQPVYPRRRRGRGMSRRRGPGGRRAPSSMEKATAIRSPSCPAIRRVSDLGAPRSGPHSGSSTPCRKSANWSGEPKKALRSTLPRMPATWASDWYCQKCHLRPG